MNLLELIDYGLGKTYEFLFNHRKKIIPTIIILLSLIWALTNFYGFIIEFPILLFTLLIGILIGKTFGMMVDIFPKAFSNSQRPSKFFDSVIGILIVVYLIYSVADLATPVYFRLQLYLTAAPIFLILTIFYKLTFQESFFITIVMIIISLVLLVAYPYILAYYLIFITNLFNIQIVV